MIGHRNNRDRRLGRNAANAPPNPFVDHQVTDDENAAIAHSSEERSRVIDCKEGARHAIPSSKIKRCSTRSHTMCAIT